ncbi:dihydrofolate reductase [Aphelenchoides avenae]|nr:dihydrofolate reductase [Aphelenchus avenae]
MLGEHSREPRVEAENDLIFANSLDEALKILTEDEQFKDRIETIWNVGGKDIYEIGLKHPWMHKLLVTRIKGDFDADVHFPNVNWDDFEQTDDFPGVKGRVEEIDKSTGLAVEWHVESYVKKQ